MLSNRLDCLYSITRKLCLHTMYIGKTEKKTFLDPGLAKPLS